MGFFDKLKDKVEQQLGQGHHQNQPQGNYYASPPPQQYTHQQPYAPPVPGNKPASLLPPDSPPSESDVYRHRQQVGANLGGLFVGERWISDEIYAACPSDDSHKSEWSAVDSAVRAYGWEDTKTGLERHWETFITESDLDDLVKMGGNSVRVPIGYFSLSRPELLAGTPYEPLGYLYGGCWSRVETLLRACRARGVGVLLDLHCVPGGANGDAHAGTDSGRSEFWENDYFRELAVRCIEFLCGAVADLHPNVIGIQVINEPTWHQHDLAQQYYTRCLDVARAHGNIPIYIGDCWELTKTADFAANHTSSYPYDFLVIDHHYYYCFAEPQTSMKVPALTSMVQSLGESGGELSEASGKGDGVNVVVGEWSCTLSGNSTNGCGDGDARAFGRTQLQTYTRPGLSGGAWFWTLKFQVRNMSNTWDLRDMVHRKVLPSNLRPQVNLPSSQHELDTNIAHIVSTLTAPHAAYWDAQPNAEASDFDGHRRYSAGAKLALEDCAGFGRHGGSLIGFRKQWTRTRVAGLVGAGGDGDHPAAWEYRHGYEAGLAEFDKLCVGSLQE
ncbi:Glucan 1,3-beta-glucosidase 3 [Savitreella phatthalungensis]